MAGPTETAVYPLGSAQVVWTRYGAAEGPNHERDRLLIGRHIIKLDKFGIGK